MLAKSLLCLGCAGDVTAALGSCTLGSLGVTLALPTATCCSGLYQAPLLAGLKREKTMTKKKDKKYFFKKEKQ